MGLRRSMVFPQRTARLLQQFAQFCRGYAVIELSADAQIGPLLALVLAEFSREPNQRAQSVVLHMLINDGEILRVPSGEAGTPQTNHNLDNSGLGSHGSPHNACNCTNRKDTSGMM